jgi:hypothetical protein
MASLELRVSDRVAGDPSYMGNADYVAVQISLKDTSTARWAAIGKFAIKDVKNPVSSGLDL